MKRTKFLWLILSLLLSALPVHRISAVQESDARHMAATLLTATPTTQPFSAPALNTPEAQAVIKTLQAYFEARYQALSTLRLDGFEPLLSSSDAAKAFWERVLWTGHQGQQMPEPPVRSYLLWGLAVLLSLGGAAGILLSLVRFIAGNLVYSVR